MLLLYIASDENMGLFDEACKDQNIVVKQMNGKRSLHQLVISDMSNLSCCQYMAVDLSCITDEKSEIIDAFVAIKSMYDFRIIILAIGYEMGNPLLGQIFAEGIYNIITEARHTSLQEQIAKCISVGMQYKDAIKFRSQSELPQRQTKQAVIQKQLIKQTISVGISGTHHRIGTTKQALHITKFLCDNGYKACYIESNDHGHAKTIAEFYDIEACDAYFVFDGIDIFPSFDMKPILAGRYEFLVCDNGLFDETSKQKFLSYDFKLICAGANAWEAPHINAVFAEMGDYTDIHFIFPFVPEGMQRQIAQHMCKLKSYFVDYAPTLVDGITNASCYKKIFEDYIHSKTTTKKGRSHEHQDKIRILQGIFGKSKETR